MDERLQTALLSQAVWLTAAWVGAAMAGGPLRERLGLVPGRLAWPAVALAVVGFLALSLASDALLRTVDLREGGSLGRLDELAEQQAGANAIAALVILGLVPAVAEELLFRGFVQRILVRRLGAVIGIFGTAALFGLAHAEPVHGMAAFGLGLFLGTLAWVAGGVGPAVLCHGFNNLVGVASAMASWQGLGLSRTAIVGLVIVAGVALWSTHRLRRPIPQGALQPGDGDAES